MAAIGEIRAWGRRVLLLLLAAGFPGVAGGCSPADEDPPHAPDRFLRDSMGFTDADRVYRVWVDAADARERARPAEVRIPPGAWVEFHTSDGRVHTVAFSLDSLPAPAAEFLRATGQDRSPPMLERNTRFLVTFEDAPAGRYPYRLEGNGAGSGGVVVVEGDEGE